MPGGKPNSQWDCKAGNRKFTRNSQRRLPGGMPVGKRMHARRKQKHASKKAKRVRNGKSHARRDCPAGRSMQKKTSAHCPVGSQSMPRRKPKRARREAKACPAGSPMPGGTTGGKKQLGQIARWETKACTAESHSMPGRSQSMPGGKPHARSGKCKLARNNQSNLLGQRGA